MAEHDHDVLNSFSDFLVWADMLKEVANPCWRKPLAENKWSLREVLTHIMHWDRNSLELMVPRMAEGAALFFVDIEKHNQEAAVLALSYSSLDVLVDELIQTRKQLLALLAAKYDDTTVFTIDNHPCTYKKFVHIFIHHDQHHKHQIEAFLAQERCV